jgi:hypothetical protein
MTMLLTETRIIIRCRAFSDTYHNLVGCGNFSDLSGAQLTVLNICGTASSNASHLSGGVDTDEDDVGFKNSSIDISGEKQVPKCEKLIV